MFFYWTHLYRLGVLCAESLQYNAGLFICLFFVVACLYKKYPGVRLHKITADWKASSFFFFFLNNEIFIIKRLAFGKRMREMKVWPWKCPATLLANIAKECQGIHFSCGKHCVLNRLVPGCCTPVSEGVNRKLSRFPYCSGQSRQCERECNDHCERDR